MVSDGSNFDKFRVDCWPNKAKKEPSAFNHIPHTKLRQLYSTEKTSDRSVVAACLDRERTSNLTRPELDKESGGPGDSHYKEKSIVFLSLPQTPEKPSGPPLLPFSVNF